MNRCHSMIVAVVGTLAFGTAYSETIDPNIKAATARFAIETCALSHGPQGHSVSPMFPIIAGQNGNNLAAQWHAFKEHHCLPAALAYLERAADKRAISVAMVDRQRALEQK